MAMARRRISPTEQRLPSRAWIEMAIETLIDLLDVIDGDCDLEAEPLERDGDEWDADAVQPVAPNDRCRRIG